MYYSKRKLLNPCGGIVMKKKIVAAISFSIMSAIFVPVNSDNTEGEQLIYKNVYAASSTYGKSDKMYQSKINSLQGNWRANNGFGISIVGTTLNGEEISSIELGAGGGSNYSGKLTILSKGWLPETKRIYVALAAEAGKPEIHPYINYDGVVYYKCFPSNGNSWVYLGNRYGDRFDYAVDKNTLINIGSSSNPRYNVYVYKYDDYAKMDYNCTFKEDKGVWKFKWQATNYKSNDHSDGWLKVSDYKIANDVLYIILH